MNTFLVYLVISPHTNNRKLNDDGRRQLKVRGEIQ